MSEIKMSSLYKALTVLDLFDKQNKALGISEIARETGMLKSSIYNIMSTFCVYGLIERTEDGKYMLGKKTAELANTFYKNYFGEFIHGVKNRMINIANEINETMFLATLNSPNIMYIDSISPATSFTMNNVQGLTVPMYCTGIGKAILSKCDESVVDEVCKLPMQSFTENTISDPVQLRKEIEIIKNRGYSIDNMEHEFGVKCVAIAFKDNQNNIYGVSISGPSLRFSNEKCEEYYQLLKQRFAAYLK